MADEGLLADETSFASGKNPHVETVVLDPGADRVRGDTGRARRFLLLQPVGHVPTRFADTLRRHEDPLHVHLR